MNEARRALEILNERGWCRGRWQNDKGELCIAGALAVAGGEKAEGGWWTPARPIAIAVICEQYGDRAGGFISFNDDPDTTFADVERVLEKVAVRLDEEEDW